MRRIHPFVQGHVVAALIVGIAAGASLGARQAAGWGAALLLAGAIVSSLVCWKWPGFEAAWWKLLPTAIFASPVMLASLGFMLADFECLVGIQKGWGCMVAAMSLLVAGACLLPPFGGLLWRGWIRRRPRGPDSRGSSPPRSPA